MTGQSEAPQLVPRTWAATPAQAMQDARLKGADWRVLACISWHANAKGYAWPSQEEIAAVTGLARPTVGKSISCLRRFGYLEIIKRDRRRGHWPHSAYRVIRRKPAELSQPSPPCHHSDYADRVAKAVTNRVTTEVTQTDP